MPPIISFIGWHNSGKTTLASQVVVHLKKRGYRIAVVKSTKDVGIEHDQPGTDTACYQRAGADAVALVAPDQLQITIKESPASLKAIAARFFPTMDLVIGEGFKHEEGIVKIEVARGPDTALRHQVGGVIALVTDQNIDGENVFRPEESELIADFIEKQFFSRDIAG